MYSSVLRAASRDPPAAGYSSSAIPTVHGQNRSRSDPVQADNPIVFAASPADPGTASVRPHKAVFAAAAVTDWKDSYSLMQELFKKKV